MRSHERRSGAALRGGACAVARKRAIRWSGDSVCMPVLFPACGGAKGSAGVGRISKTREHLQILPNFGGLVLAQPCSVHRPPECATRPPRSGTAPPRSARAARPTRPASLFCTCGANPVCYVSTRHAELCTLTRRSFFEIIEHLTELSLYSNLASFQRSSCAKEKWASVRSEHFREMKNP